MDEELEVLATELLVLGIEGGLPAEPGLLGRTRAYLSHRLIFLFLRYGISDWARREGRTVCFCGYFTRLWDFNEDVKSLLLSLYNF